MRFFTLFVVSVLLLLSCNHSVSPHFGATERYLIMSGQVSQSMSVVENDNTAGNEFLRQQAADIPYDETTRHLFERMLATVKKERGVGIAAPQVGISRKMVLVQRFDKPDKPFFPCLNPTDISLSKQKKLGWEGCLSVPAGFGQVKRSTEISLVCHTLDGKPVKETVSGFTAVIFQHELDHLNGILFIDRMDKGEKVIPKEEYRRMRKQQKKQKKEEDRPHSKTTS